MTDVQANVEAVRRRLVEAGGADVRLVAVTKGFGVDEVRAALQAGLSDIGENYAQELVAKVEDLGADVDPPPTWHFIGHLQRNKIRPLAAHVAVWQSVDRPEVAREIAKRAPGATVFVQINVSGEVQKAGCEFDAAPDLVAECRRLGLATEGVMAIGPNGPPDRAREPFRRLVGLADELGLRERSIGMSADLEVAVAAGSTMVRVGRDLFGERPAR